MTKDTARALEIIKPLADELHIAVEADETILYMNGQPIGIACNSTYATLMEMIGWIFLKVFALSFRRMNVNSIRGDIERYWISREALKKIKSSAP